MNNKKFERFEQPSKGSVPNGGFLVGADAWRIIYEDEKYLIVKRKNKGSTPWYTQHIWTKFLWFKWWSNLDWWGTTPEGMIKDIQRQNDPHWMDEV